MSEIPHLLIALTKKKQQQTQRYRPFHADQGCFFLHLVVPNRFQSTVATFTGPIITCEMLKVHSQAWDNLWPLKALTKWWHDKCFLVHLQSSFRSEDIYIFVLTLTSCKRTAWLEHSHKKRKDSLETRGVFSRIPRLTWNFGGGPTDSASTFFKMASVYGNFLCNHDFHVVITIIGC